MPNCKKYLELAPVEKIMYIGQLLHATQSDDVLFELGKDLIDLAMLNGVFNGVIINPDTTTNKTENNDTGTIN